MVPLNDANEQALLLWVHRIRAFAPFLAGFAFGWCIWAFSTLATGSVEPWDGNVNCYWGCLLVAGFVSALLDSRWWFLSPLGVYLGQIAYMETVYRSTLPVGDPLIFPSFIAVAVFGFLPAIFGAVLAFVAHRLSLIFRRKGHDCL